MRYRCAAVCMVIASAFLLACSGPEAKKMKFYDKGKALCPKVLAGI